MFYSTALKSPFAGTWGPLPTGMHQFLHRRPLTSKEPWLFRPQFAAAARGSRRNKPGGAKPAYGRVGQDGYLSSPTLSSFA